MDDPPPSTHHHQQTSNQDNSPGGLHRSHTFNGPIHGYIEHATGSGPIIAYSKVTHVESSEQNKPGLSDNGTANKVPNQTKFTAPSAASSARPPSRPETASDGRGGNALILDHAIEAEIRLASPQMQEYIQYLRQYEK